MSAVWNFVLFFAAWLSAMAEMRQADKSNNWPTALGHVLIGFLFIAVALALAVKA